LTSQITLVNGRYALLIDAEYGARIRIFSLDGTNALTEMAPQTGSTFWPSPQSVWGWPPPPKLDSEPYQATQTGSAWVFTSNPCPLTGLAVSKIARPVDGGFSLEYRLHNPGDKKLQYAAWEITRVDGGLTFYRAQMAPQANSTLPVTKINDSYWYDYRPAGFGKNLKLFANRSIGWLANANNGLLLKKIFSPVPVDQIAPGEAEVEIYAHGDDDNPYIEIEQQGAFVEIEPGATVAWTVMWKLAAIPQDISLIVGNEALLAMAEAL
jgi:hypothetical protein